VTIRLVFGQPTHQLLFIGLNYSPHKSLISSSTLQFHVVWVSLVAASNENFIVFMAFLDTHMFSSPPVFLYICGVWSISWRSPIVDAPIEEQPPIL